MVWGRGLRLGVQHVLWKGLGCRVYRAYGLGFRRSILLEVS